MSSGQLAGPTTRIERLYRYIVSADVKLRSFLLRNGRGIRLAEDGLRGMALLLPGGDAEIRAEAASVVLSLLQVYRDAGSQDVPRDVLNVGSMKVSCRLLMVALASLRAVELLAEMVTERYKGGKWGTLTGIEGSKMLLRLMLIACRWKQGLVCEELPSAGDFATCTCGMGNLEGAKYVDLKKGKRTGKVVYVLNETVPDGKELDILFETAYERRAAWFTRMLGAEQNCPACSSKHEATYLAEQPIRNEGNLAHPPHVVENTLSIEATLGEVLYITRPFVQLLLIRRYGWRSWRAWLLALGVDMVARKLRFRDISLHQDERQRRTLQLLLYLVRSPFFDIVIKRFLQSTANGLRRVPLLGHVASSTLDLVSALQVYWFYTAAS